MVASQLFRFNEVWVVLKTKESTFTRIFPWLRVKFTGFPVMSILVFTSLENSTLLVFTFQFPLFSMSLTKTKEVPEPEPFPLTFPLGWMVTFPKMVFVPPLWRSPKFPKTSSLPLMVAFVKLATQLPGNSTTKSLQLPFISVILCKTLTSVFALGTAFEDQLAAVPH